jgi:hypothetical protein
MTTFNTSNEEYVAVLETEAETLRRYYYNPDQEGTGHFNTAVTVLENRIKEIKNELHGSLH